MILGARGRLIFISIIGLILFIPAAYIPVTAASADPSGVLIHQLQTGDTAAAGQEYISIYNNSDQAVDVTGWCVIYSSASDITQTQLACLETKENSRVFLKGHGTWALASNEFLAAHSGERADATFSSGISGTSGHLKLLDSSKTLQDLVGWGTATAPESKATPAHSLGKAFQRLKLPSNLLQDTDNNFTDFSAMTLAPAREEGLYEEAVPFDVSAYGLVITELLANAAGADEGREFIELYNPSSRAINLKAFSLLVGPAFSKTHPLPDLEVQPGQYIALSDDQTDLTLPNSSASIQLLAPGGHIISQTDSYNEPKDDVSWALINGFWQETSIPTPGSPNIASVSASAGPGLMQQLCNIDQELNPATGRCRKTSSASIASCKPNQERSRETGRCRNIASALAATAACKVGEERNPLTKRCRKIVSPASAKACPKGQERHSETNRCRKKVQGSTASQTSVKDVPSGLLKNNVKWWFSGIAAVSSLGYAGYEWRRDIINKIYNLKQKIFT